jgi:hypothetical protein
MLITVCLAGGELRKVYPILNSLAVVYIFAKVRCPKLVYIFPANPMLVGKLLISPPDRISAVNLRGGARGISANHDDIFKPTRRAGSRR